MLLVTEIKLKFIVIIINFISALYQIPKAFLGTIYFKVPLLHVFTIRITIYA